jgi:hypothetical protein
VRSDCLEQDRFFLLVLNERKNNSDVVSRTTGPGTVEITFELVSAEAGVKRVLG